MTKSEANKLWYAANREREREKRLAYYYANRDKCLAWQEAYKRQKHGGIFDRLLVEQQGQCGICRSELLKPCLDHDHKTGRIRGLLCDSCNLGLGKFLDNAELLERAAQYLKENQNGKTSIEYRVKEQSYCAPNR